MTNRKVSVVLPTFNERENILPLLDALHVELKNHEHELIVVDDNSSDGTFEAVRQKSQPWVRAVLRTKDPGLAKSIRQGIEEASGEFIVIMDSDFNHQPKYLPVLIDSLAHYDVVIGSRFLYGGDMEPPARRYLSWVFNIFVRLITGGFVTDNLYGYVAIKAKTLKSLDFDEIFWGYGDYCIRLLYYLQKNKVSILQVPMINGERAHGQAHGRFLSVFWQYFQETVKLAIHTRFTKHHH